jgi:ABC-type amino acid transport substrate-binding protein
LRPGIAIVFGIAALAGLPTAFAAAPLKVCVLTHNAPYTTQHPEDGFDLATARAVAAALKRPLEAVWVDNPEIIQEVEESDFPLRKLARGGCDALFSVPGPARDTLKGQDDLALGAAYYGAAFELIGPAGTPGNLKALAQQPVAIQAQTIASFALAMLHARQKTYFAPLPALEAVARGDAHAALLWGPTAGWALKQHPDLALAVADGYEPPTALRWNLHTATRAKDDALRAQIDQALAALAASGELATLAEKYGMRVHTPFATTYTLGAINELH